MPGGRYHDDLWELVPEGSEPTHFKRRLAFLLSHVNKANQPARVLDVGCGEGRFSDELARAGARVVAMDVAREPLRRASARNPALEVRLIGEDEPWPFDDASFDVVWAGEVIEHVADTAGWLSEARRVLRSGGTLLLSTPAHTPLERLRLGLSRRAFEAHFDPRSDHLRFYTRRTLGALLADFGFKEVSISVSGALARPPAVMLAAARRSRF